jgi:predicted amidohydrolase YtcJ
MNIVLINGNIQTLNEANQIVEALVIQDSIISLIGETNHIKASNLHFDQIIDLEGKTVLPGFADCHTHLGQIALESLWVDLGEAISKNQILEILGERIKTTKSGAWVVGVNYKIWSLGGWSQLR